MAFFNQIEKKCVTNGRNVEKNMYLNKNQRNRKTKK